VYSKKRGRRDGQGGEREVSRLEPVASRLSGSYDPHGGGVQRARVWQEGGLWSRGEGIRPSEAFLNLYTYLNSSLISYKLLGYGNEWLDMESHRPKRIGISFSMCTEKFNDINSGVLQLYTRDAPYKADTRPRRYIPFYSHLVPSKYGRVPFVVVGDKSRVLTFEAGYQNPSTGLSFQDPSIS